MKRLLKIFGLAGLCAAVASVMVYYTIRGIDQDLRDHYAEQIGASISGQLPADLLN